MREIPHPSHFPGPVAAPRRETLLREAMAGHWAGKTWLEKMLDRMEAGR